MNKLITILLLFTNSLTAQEDKAQNILHKLSNAAQSYKNIIIDFDFILENKSQKIKETEKGNITIERNKFKLEMADQIIINDGITQWVYLPQENEVQIIDNEPAENIMNPNRLFTIYKEGYRHNYIGSESKSGKKLEIIDLLPEISREFIKITLTIDSKANQLDRITIYDKNGVTYTYVVKSFKVNNKIEPLTFDSKKYPGIQIIDLR